MILQIFRFISCVFIFLFSVSISLLASETEDLLDDTRLIEWQLIDIDYSLSKQLDDEDEYQNISALGRINIKFSDNQLIIDADKSIAVQEGCKEDNVSLGKLKAYSLDKYNINNDIGEKCFNFSLSNDRYSLVNQAVYLPNYLFIYTQDNLILTFQPKSQLKEEFSKVYSQLKSAQLPLDNQYNPRQGNDGFSSIPEKFKYFFKNEVGDNTFYAMKLAEINSLKLVLFSSYSESGSPSLSLLNFSNDFDLIDKIVLSEEYELENGRVDTTYTISRNYNIVIKEIEYVDFKPEKVLSSKRYSINKDGFFIEYK